jgi:hypothetical protein
MYGSHASEATPKMDEQAGLTDDMIKAAISTGVQPGKSYRKLTDSRGLFLLLQAN